jgi:P-type conjugative transfer protein TrbJ
MKRVYRVILIGGLLWSGGAFAQLVVVDPVNLIQTTLTAIREAEQVANEVQMLENEAKNLEHLNINTLGRLQSLLSTTQQLLNQTGGIAFQLAQAEATFKQFYPNSYEGASGDQMIADAQARWMNSHEALRTAIALQAQAAQNEPTDQGVLSDLITSSQAADGALQAMQATNQLLAFTARHLLQSEHVAISQDRAMAAETARAVEAQERARVLRERFMTGFANYDPTPINLF